MARYQVILAYDGTGFQGSQRQASKTAGRTVQGELERALRRIGWKGNSLLMAGRTDTGVHASAQVAAFDLEWRHPDEELVQALNAYLPADMAVRSASVVEDRFHPRYAAQSRQYRYRIFCDPTRSPLMERFAWRVWPAVNPDWLQAAGAHLIGSWDFASFGSPPRTGGSTIRTVHSAGWQVEGENLEFVITGNAFLYHMVRRLVHTQVLIGQGRLALDAFKKALESHHPVPPGLAPAHGLVLAHIEYRKMQESLIRNAAEQLQRNCEAASGDEDRG